MKKLLFASLIMLSLAFAGFSQTIPPPYINYQAVLYDVNGTNPNSPLTNQSFSTFVNINDELGNLLYREEHYASTDANGLITIKMGDGLYTAGPITNFNQINWGVGKYYLVVDFNINGTISSTAPEQLVTVPYSFYAGNAGNGMTAVADNGNGTLTFTYANGQTYITPALSGMTGPVGPAGAQGIQGLPGANGAAGATGQNGLNALIKTTSEAAGANCTNGGTKIETGLDANGNGVLDSGEVNISQTTFLCIDISTIYSSSGEFRARSTSVNGQLGAYNFNIDTVILNPGETFELETSMSVGNCCGGNNAATISINISNTSGDEISSVGGFSTNIQASTYGPTYGNIFVKNNSNSIKQYVISTNANGGTSIPWGYYSAWWRCVLRKY